MITTELTTSAGAGFVWSSQMARITSLLRGCMSKSA